MVQGRHESPLGVGIMSTIDPAQVRRAKEAARQGSVGAAIGVVLGNVLMLAGGAFSGIGAAGDTFLGNFRDRALNHFFSDSFGPSGWELAALPIGIVLPIIAMFVLTAAAKAYTGTLMSFPVVGPLTVWLAGFSVGFAYWVRQWPEPHTVGVRTDTAFGDDEPWSSSDWGWYHADGWLPWIPVAATLISLAVGIAARRRKVAKRRELDRLVREGWRTQGDVTAIPSLTEGSALLTQWTVHFVDLNGTDRWVTSTGKFPRDDLPRVGDFVSVLYDQAAPGDKRRIYLGALEAHTAEDFLKWRL